MANDEHKTRHDSDAPAKSKRRKVGDPTPNPLPDGDYSIPQQPNDDNQSNS